ncbi:WD40/YVTN/BNR-like repeat-containing protein [Tahibacter soli]|uniref:BNR/Asp-box repeat protein n=1 Tax=Tahibacter soli TaxID=2983605 RepID=A0A9X4BFQ7_9GAMM|nr:hypothetical protein [Tahibacter soli]MDC8011580.1 hypothetical protein [Tahibacter soli]
MSKSRFLVALTALAAAGGAIAAVGSWSTAGPYGGSVQKILVYEAGPSTLWAIGGGGVFRSLSGGGSWSRIEVGLPDSLFPVDLAAATAAPVTYVASQSRVYRSGNGGDLWVTTAFTPPAGSFVRGIALRRGTTNTVATVTDHAVLLSTDGGATAATAGGLDAAATYASIAYASDGTLYVVVQEDPNNTYGGASLIKSATGSAWSPVAAPVPLFGGSPLAISPNTPQRLYASDTATVATSANAGGTWNAVNLPANCGQVMSLTVHPTNPLSLYVGCVRLGLVATADATLAAPAWTTWNAANGLGANGTGDPAAVVSLALHPAFLATPSLWAASQYGGLFASTNGGTTWSGANAGFQSVNIRALATHPLDANIVLAGQGDSFTTAPALFRSLDSAATWSTSHANLNAEQVRTLAIDPTTVDADPFTNENFVVYAGGRSERLPAVANKDGGLYKSVDRGATWTTIDSGIAVVNGRPDMGTVRGIWLDPRSCAAPPPSGPCAAGSGPLQKILAVGSGIADLSAPGMPYRSARVYRSTNAGGAWTASETGLPLPQDLGAGAYAYMGGAAAIVADPGNANILYIGTFLSYPTGVPGAATPSLANGVFKSLDGGTTWTHASNGMPRVGGTGTSHYDVLALAISHANPQVLYAATVKLTDLPLAGAVYKTTDGGANWTAQTTGIAGQDVRALFVDRNDPTGNTVYAATGGGSTDPGGVYRTTDGGATWNSYSLGLPANSATALAMPPRATGAPARILAGTGSGVWDYTETPDGDADGAPNALEAQVGDGNGDGTPDESQRGVASVVAPPSGLVARGTNIAVTTAIASGCTQLNNSANIQADLFPPDPAGSATSHDPWGLMRIELPACANAVVDVTFHGANFASGGWFWRNYGPRRRGDDGTFGWYTFAGAVRLDADTWRLSIDATRQGNYRNDANNVLFIGGPAQLPEMIFANGFE